MMARVMVLAIMSVAIAILTVRWRGKTRRWNTGQCLAGPQGSAGIGQRHQQE
jgi:hypothetical protein